MKKTLFVLAVCTTMIFAGCTAKTEPAPVVTEATTKTYEGEGFTFIYPEKYTVDEFKPADNAPKYTYKTIMLWDEEGYKYHKNPPEGCSTCQIPAIQIISEQTNVSLDQFMISYFTIPEAKTFEESAKIASMPYSKVKLGDNEFTRTESYGMISSTDYFTKKGEIIVGFEVFDTRENPDNEELKTITSSLKFK